LPSFSELNRSVIPDLRPGDNVDNNTLLFGPQRKPPFPFDSGDQRAPSIPTEGLDFISTAVLVSLSLLLGSVGTVVTLKVMHKPSQPQSQPQPSEQITQPSGWTQPVPQLDEAQDESVVDSAEKTPSKSAAKKASAKAKKKAKKHDEEEKEPSIQGTQFQNPVAFSVPVEVSTENLQGFFLLLLLLSLKNLAYTLLLSFFLPFK